MVPGGWGVPPRQKNMYCFIAKKVTKEREIIIIIKNKIIIIKKDVRASLGNAQ